MTRRQIGFLFLLLSGLTVWGIVRPDKTARAGGPPEPEAPARETVAVDYAENGEEAATHRWATNQARHWRQLMIKR